MNYPTATWEALRRGRFHQFTDPDLLRELQVAFLHGMNTGRELVIQSTQLKNRECSAFNEELRKQVHGELAHLGERPGKVTLSAGPKVVATSNGDSV